MPKLASLIIRQHDVLLSTGTAVHVLPSDRVVPAGEVWRIERHGFRLLTDQNDLVRSFIDSGGDLHLLNEWVAPANPFFYVDPYSFLLSEGERLALEVTNATAADVIHLIYSGLIIESPHHHSAHPAVEVE